MDERQFVAVEFKRGGRSYTYHNDGAPVAAGDNVVVSTKRGPQGARVVSTSREAPPFATKAIVGLQPTY